MEPAPRWRVDRARNVALQHHALGAPRRVRNRRRRQQRPGVGVLAVGIELLRWRDLDDAAEIHHRDTAADMFDDAQIVRNEEIGQLEFLLQILHQVQDLRLDRHVERGNRFVGDDELGIDGKRARDADALALTAREFVRITAVIILAQADLFQQFDNALLAIIALGDVMDLHAFADDLADAHARVERGVGVLEDDLHLAPQIAHRVGIERGYVGAFEIDAARSGFEQPDHEAPEGRLAAARFTHQPQRFPVLDFERYVVDRPDVITAVPRQPPVHRKIFFEVADFHQRHGQVTLMQATQWPASISTRSGTTAAQSASAWAQRVRNRQPDGQSSGLGTMPGIASSRSFAAAVPGTEFISPMV